MSHRSVRDVYPFFHSRQQLSTLNLLPTHTFCKYFVCLTVSRSVHFFPRVRSLSVSLSTSCTDAPGYSYDWFDAFPADTLEHRCLRVARLSACARRLHFAVPGARDGSSGSNSGGSGGGGGGGGRLKFPSRQKQFLGFVSLSQWLLEQLGNGGDGDRDGDGGGDRAPISTVRLSSSDTPTTVCANLLRVCQVR